MSHQYSVSPPPAWADDAPPWAMEILQELAEIRAAIAKPAEPSRTHYSVAEAAEILGRSEYTVRRWCRDDYLKADKSGEQWVIPESEVAWSLNHMRKPR